MMWEIDSEGDEFQFTKGGKFVYKEVFLKLFGNDFSFNTLMKNQKTHPGWKEVFRLWKEQGILN